MTPAETLAAKVAEILAPAARLLVIASSDKPARVELTRLTNRALDVVNAAHEADRITWDEMRALEALVAPVVVELAAKTPRQTAAQIKAAYAPKGPTWKQRNRAR